MKKSIKVAALTLLATGLLAGCSSGGSSNPKKQEITASATSVEVGIPIVLATNVESGATWTMSDNTCDANFITVGTDEKSQSVSGVTATVSAEKAGSVTVKASASGYTSPTVKLTFTAQPGPQPVVQVLTVDPESGEASVSETISISTNADSASWSLSDNTCGAQLSVSSGKSVVVSASSAGSVVVSAVAEEYTAASVSLTFTAAPGPVAQVLTVVPESKEAYVSESISVSTNASSASWSLSDNTCGAQLSAESGKSVVVSAASAGSVVISASAEGYSAASETLTFVADPLPDWTDEEKEEMRELLYGEVLPYVYGTEEEPLFFVSGDMARIEAGEISSANLAAYAENFSLDEGWVALKTSTYEYFFEKCISTEDGDRYVGVNFGSFDEEYEGVEDGNFLLIAYDPYIYQFPTYEFENIAKKELKISSEIQVPEVEADRFFWFSDSEKKEYGALCYYASEEEDGGYSAILSASENFTVYGYQDLFDCYVADSKDGAFGLIYYYDAEEGALAIQISEAIFSAEFPSALVAEYVKAEFDSEIALPAYEGADYYYSEGDRVFCYTSDSESELSYGSVLGAAGWYVYGSVQFSDGSYAFLADSPDGKYGIQYFYYADYGFFAIFVDECNYLHAFPSEEMNALAAAFESEVEIPALEADYYMYAESYSCALCFYFDGAEGDCGYGEVLAAAGWNVLGYDSALAQYLAQSPDEKFYAVYYVEENYLVIELKESVFLEEFPAEEFANFTENYFYNETPVPAVEADYYSFNSDYGRGGAYYSSEAADGGYGAILEAAGFTLSFYSEVEEDGSVTHFAFSPVGELDDRYVVYYSYFEGCLTIGVNFGTAMAYQTSAWSQDAINEVFLINGYQSFEVPAMTVASEEAKFFTTTYERDYGLFSFPYSADVYVFGATEEEIGTYLDELKLAGWIFEEDSAPEEGSAKKVVEILGEQKYAYISWGIIEGDEESEGFFYVSAVFGFGIVPAASFPSDKIAAAFEALGVTPFTIPEPDGEGYTFEYEFDEGNLEYVEEYPEYCYDSLYVNDMSEEQFLAWMDKMELEGWDVSSVQKIVDAEDETSYYYSGYALKHFGEEGEGSTATLNILWEDSEDYGQYAGVVIYYVMEEDSSGEASDALEVMKDLDMWIWPEEYDFELDFKGPDEDGIVYCVYGLITEVTEDSEEALVGAIEGLLSEEGFPEYLGLASSISYDSESGVAYVYLITDDESVVVYFEAEFNSEEGAVCIYFQAGPAEAYME